MFILYFYKNYKILKFNIKTFKFKNFVKKIHIPLDISLTSFEKFITNFVITSLLLF